MPDLVFSTKGTAEVIRQQQKINEGAVELGKIYQQDARHATELEKAVSRIFKSGSDPAKAFETELGKITKSFKDGKINADQYERGVRKLEGAFKDTQTLSGKLERSLSGAFGPKALDGIKSMAAGLTGAGGLLAALQLIRSEYQAQRDLIDKAARTQLDVGQSRNVLIRNILGESPDSIRSTIESVGKTATAVRLPEQVLNLAMADALSASNGNVGKSLAATTLASKFLADRPDEIGDFSGALLDAERATGVADPNVNFGLLARIGQLSRITSPQKIARNAPQAIGGSVSYGATFTEGAALFSALTAAATDPMGEQSRTGQLGFAKSLGLTFPESLRASGETALADQFQSRTLGQNIAALQQNPALAQQFLHTQGVTLGDSVTVAPLRNLLLKPQSRIAQDYRRNLSSIGTEQDLARLAKDAISNFSLNSLEPLAVTERALASSVQQAEIARPLMLSQMGEQDLKRRLNLAGQSNLGSNLTTLITQLGDGELGTSIPSVAGLLRSQATSLRGPVRPGLFASLGAESMSEAMPATPTASALATAKEFDKLAKIMEEQVKLQQQQLDAQNETNRKIGETGLIGVDE